MLYSPSHRMYIPAKSVETGVSPPVSHLISSSHESDDAAQTAMMADAKVLFMLMSNS